MTNVQKVEPTRLPMFAANAIIDCILAKSADATLVACTAVAAAAAAAFQTSEKAPKARGSEIQGSRFRCMRTVIIWKLAPLNT